MSSRKWKESNYRSGYHCYHYYVCLSSRNFYICRWKAQWPFHWFRVRRFLINQQKIRFCARITTSSVGPSEAKQTWCNNALWRFVETICSVKEVTLLFVSPYWITTSFVKGLNASKITYMLNPRVHNPLWPFPKGQYQVTLTPNMRFSRGSKTQVFLEILDGRALTKCSEYQAEAWAVMFAILMVGPDGGFRSVARLSASSSEFQCHFHLHFTSITNPHSATPAN